MKTIRKICVTCPAGCHLEITSSADGNITVTGNRCIRGRKYAETELTDPRRTVTAGVLTAGSIRRCIPVKSAEPVPVKKIPELLKELRSMRLSGEIHRGDIIISNFAGTDIDIIAAADS